MILRAKTKKQLKTPLSNLCMYLPSKNPKTETPAMEMIPSQPETVLQ